MEHFTGCLGVTLWRKRRVVRQVESCYYATLFACCFPGCLRWAEEAEPTLLLLLHLIPCIVPPDRAHMDFKTADHHAEAVAAVPHFRSVKNTNQKCQATCGMENKEAVTMREYK